MQIFRIMWQFFNALAGVSDKRAPLRHATNKAKESAMTRMPLATASLLALAISLAGCGDDKKAEAPATPAASTQPLSLIHISEPTRQAEISYAVFCLKKKKKN